MVERAVNNYYKFFDETISSSTFIVLMIVSLIFMIGSIVPHANANTDYMVWSILDVQNLETEKNIVTIDWVEYELQFLKIK